jgi:hypothetical protein
MFLASLVGVPAVASVAAVAVLLTVVYIPFIIGFSTNSGVLLLVRVP